ncbi:hypothetical protein SEA_TUNATARTARE_112 [Streptomyces phage TunaTartare]|jgi:hypothetical protein|uniref:Uncharacterized protein n=1 Tax=Streptomyces phage TunaTartare TaxID=2848887 RepID=A0A8F2E6N4_9CAUD|nr:hypothetical protein PP457_gp146 [Streptomyces phage TunaTartare]QWT29996.1 hypothetical protein SEA_TUNATARTARE_112 [Streptomyces phage TunaTartare]
MIDLAELQKAGVTVKKFCGLDAQEGVGCPEEAVGEIIAVMEDDVEVPIPVCEFHLELIMAEYEVEKLPT